MPQSLTWSSSNRRNANRSGRFAPDRNDRRQAGAILGVVAVRARRPSSLLDERLGALDILARGLQGLLRRPSSTAGPATGSGGTGRATPPRPSFPCRCTSSTASRSLVIREECSTLDVVVHGEPNWSLVQVQGQSLFRTVEAVPQEERRLARERLDEPVDGTIANGLHGICLGSNEPHLDCRRGRSPSIERVECPKVHAPSGIDVDHFPWAGSDREFVVVVEDAIRRLDGIDPVTGPDQGKGSSRLPRESDRGSPRSHRERRHCPDQG